MPPKASQKRPSVRHASRRFSEIPSGGIKIPESMMELYAQCRRVLGGDGSMVSNAEVIRWLLENARPQIEQMARDAAVRDAPPNAIIEDETPDKDKEEVTQSDIDSDVLLTPNVIAATPTLVDTSTTVELEQIIPNTLPDKDMVLDSQHPEVEPIVDAPTVEPESGFVKLGRLKKFFVDFKIRCSHPQCKKDHSSSTTSRCIRYGR